MISEPEAWRFGFFTKTCFSQAIFVIATRNSLKVDVEIVFCDSLYADEFAA